MTHDNDFRMGILTERLENLREMTERLLRSTDNGRLADELAERLGGLASRGYLRIAFVGQYNAGKSTVISALTGNRAIRIDSDVATDRVTEYEWNDLRLVDTPGILAGVCEAHDERAMKAMRESDIIVYVVTSKLFDDLSFENFIDLAFKRRMMGKMMFVVNKVNSEFGDVEELISNYRESLNEIFRERGYDGFPLSPVFIDAKDYIEGIDDGDSEMVELSRFETFVERLNGFVGQNGFERKRLDTPARILQGFLGNVAVAEIDPSLAEFYRQYEVRLDRCLFEMERQMELILGGFESEGMSMVIEVSKRIGEVDPEQWRVTGEKLDVALEKLVSETSVGIETMIYDNYERLAEEMHDFSQKDSILRYAGMIDAKIESPDVDLREKKSLEVVQKGVEWLSKGIEKATKNSPELRKALDGLCEKAGKDMHKHILDVVGFFGKKFKPWESAGVVGKFGKGAKLGLPIAMALVDIGMQIRSDINEKKKIERIAAARNEYVAAFQSRFEQTKRRFEEAFSSVRENFAEKRAELERSRSSVINELERNDATRREINAISADLDSFLASLGD